jgi:IMP dehydrogenase
MNIISQVGLTFDDVLLVPRCSTIDSRFNGDIDLSTSIAGIPLKRPIISANMDTVTECRMVAAMHREGGLGIIHRFMPPEDHYVQLAKIDSPIVICIGVCKSSRDRLSYIFSRLRTSQPTAVLIDIAHGHCTAMIEQIRWVKQTLPNTQVIAGNIATFDAAMDLLAAGADCLKVGVGPGALCSTRVKTGCGAPQLTAISEVLRATQEINRPIDIIADGGIRNSGDIVKALAAGANAVMIGNLLAGTEEAPGETYLRGSPPTKYKLYRGMASLRAQESWKGYATSVEGESKDVPYKGLVKEVFQDLLAGILSGMSYQNAHNIGELQKNHLFIRQTTSGYRESVPHGL